MLYGILLQLDVQVHRIHYSLSAYGQIYYRYLMLQEILVKNHLHLKDQKHVPLVLRKQFQIAQVRQK